MENLPQGKTSPAHPAGQAPVDLRDLPDADADAASAGLRVQAELIYVPFFGWAMGRMDMIHIDRSQRAQAFNKVVEQGKRLLAQGIWIIMFPEGTRIPRGQKGDLQDRRHAAGDRDRRAGDPDRRDLGQVLAAQGLHQAPGHRRRVDRQADPQRGPPARRTDARGQAWIEAEMRRLDPRPTSVQELPRAMPSDRMSENFEPHSNVTSNTCAL